MLPFINQVFLPAMSLSSIKDLHVRERLKAIAQEAQQHYQHRVPRQHAELLCDHVFTPPLDGFGTEALQYYLKAGISVTWLHDEIWWMAALNYMLRNSVGCAYWIAIGIHDLKQLMSVMDIDALLVRKDFSVAEVGKLLDKLISLNTWIEWGVQIPGCLVASPPGVGAMHLVVTNGIMVSQIAWNTSFTIPGVIALSNFWGELHTDQEFGHVFLDNGSMSSRAVIPIFTMEDAGYCVCMRNKLDYYHRSIKQLQAKRDLSITFPTDSINSRSCKNCNYRQDWCQIDGRCIHCYFKDPKILKLLQS